MLLRDAFSCSLIFLCAALFPLSYQCPFQNTIFQLWLHQCSVQNQTQLHSFLRDLGLLFWPQNWTENTCSFLGVTFLLRWDLMFIRDCFSKLSPQRCLASFVSKTYDHQLVWLKWFLFMSTLPCGTIWLSIECLLFYFPSYVSFCWSMYMWENVGNFWCAVMSYITSDAPWSALKPSASAIHHLNYMFLTQSLCYLQFSSTTALCFLPCLKQKI